MDFPGGSVVKNLPANAGNAGLIPESRRSPAEGNDNPLWYSCLENPMDREAWWAIAHGIQRVRHELVTNPLKEHFTALNYWESLLCLILLNPLQWSELCPPQVHMLKC